MIGAENMAVGDARHLKIVNWLGDGPWRGRVVTPPSRALSSAGGWPYPG